jgi:hypothetical protein
MLLHLFTCNLKSGPPCTELSENLIVYERTIHVNVARADWLTKFLLFVKNHFDL